MIELTFLGTGTSQGVPVIACECDVCLSSDTRDKRLRTSVMISYRGKNIVIDSGPDFRQQMLREKVLNIEAIVYTHEHKDHVAGMDDVRAFNFKHKKDMPVYVDEAVEKALVREFPYVFSDFKYPGVPKVELNRIDKSSSFDLIGLHIEAIEVMHYKLPVLGFRFGDLTYITDANYIAEEEKEKIKGSKILVLNALQLEKHISHFTLEEALSFIEEIKPEKAYLTHISHRMGTHEEASKLLPKNVFFAYDGLRVNC